MYSTSTQRDSWEWGGDTVPYTARSEYTLTSICSEVKETHQGANGSAYSTPQWVDFKGMTYWPHLWNKSQGHWETLSKPHMSGFQGYDLLTWPLERASGALGVMQSFQSFQSRLHIAHCNHSRDYSIGMLESRVNSNGLIMRETLPF